MIINDNVTESRSREGVKEKIFLSILCGITIFTRMKCPNTDRLLIKYSFQVQTNRQNSPLLSLPFEHEVRERPMQGC